MSNRSSSTRSILLPFLVFAFIVALWAGVWASGAFHESAFPSPLSVVRAFRQEIGNGHPRLGQ